LLGDPKGSLSGFYVVAMLWSGDVVDDEVFLGLPTMPWNLFGRADDRYQHWAAIGPRSHFQ